MEFRREKSHLSMDKYFQKLHILIRKFEGCTVVQLAYRPPADDEEEATETVLAYYEFSVLAVGGGKEAGTENP